MTAALAALDLVSEPFFIPVWFYGYSAAVYGASAIVSMLVAVFSYRFYRMTKSRSNLALALGFVFMTVSFAALTFTSVYTYFYSPFFQDVMNFGNLGLVNSIGFNAYYITATIAYISLLMMYLPKDISEAMKGDFKRAFSNKMFTLYLPLWFLDFDPFHMVALAILSYIVIRNAISLYRNRRRDLNGFLVLLAFAAMLLSHTSLMLIGFDPTIYLAANTLLVAGFLSLLLMLIRVNRSGAESG